MNLEQYGMKEGKIYNILFKCDIDGWVIIKQGKPYLMVWSRLRKDIVYMEQVFFDLTEICAVSEAPYSEEEYVEWMRKENGDRKVGIQAN